MCILSESAEFVGDRCHLFAKTCRRDGLFCAWKEQIAVEMAALYDVIRHNLLLSVIALVAYVDIVATLAVLVVNLLDHVDQKTWDDIERTAVGALVRLLQYTDDDAFLASSTIGSHTAIAAFGVLLSMAILFVWQQRVLRNQHERVKDLLK